MLLLHVRTPSVHRPVPLGCRRAGHFLLKESWPKKQPPAVAPAARVRGCLRGAPIAIPGVRRASASLALALRADPSGRRRAEGGEKRQSKRPRTGADDQERRRSNHPSLGRHVRPGLPSPGVHGLRPFHPSRRCGAGRKVRRRGARDRAPAAPVQGCTVAAPAGVARTRAAGAARGAAFLWFLSLAEQRKEHARRRRVEALEGIGGSRAEPGGVSQPQPDTSLRSA